MNDAIKKRGPEFVAEVAFRLDPDLTCLTGFDPKRLSRVHRIRIALELERLAKNIRRGRFLQGDKMVPCPAPKHTSL